MSGALAKVSSLIESGIAAGLHTGAQVYASINGQLAADLAFGVVRPDTLMLWLSSGKPIAAAAIGQLWERGKLELDDRVAQHIPEFAAGGKENITIRHLLTHTGGFRGAVLNFTFEPWETVIQQICTTRLETGWIPGKKAGYHRMSSWLILGELVRRLDGRPFERYVREEIFLPLGMNDCWIGMPREQYRAYGDRIGQTIDTSGAEPPIRFKSNTEEGCAVCNPGANGRGSARELAFFYEAIISRGQRHGTRILSPQTVEALTACHRRGMYDHTFAHMMDWGMGFMVNSEVDGNKSVPYSFGERASPRVTGHAGSQSSVGFADPEHGLAATIIFDGCCGEVKHAVRMRAVATALYEDLGLTS